jgi:hypothetical protein
VGLLYPCLVQLRVAAVTYRDRVQNRSFQCNEEAAPFAVSICFNAEGNADGFPLGGHRSPRYFPLGPIMSAYLHFAFNFAARLRIGVPLTSFHKKAFDCISATSAGGTIRWLEH